MARRRAWNGKPPRTEAEARRILLDVTQDCIERFGLSKVGLSDVAAAAGVTRQTVYRYFVDADDLFNAAAVLASGGFLERLRERVRERQGLAERAVESLVVAIREIPKDAHLSTLVRSSDSFDVSSALKLNFVQEELLTLAEGAPHLSASDRDELAELLVRLMRSFLDDPGPERSEEELRIYLSRWLVPVIEEKLQS
ncbi:MAG: TetR/AcrR family transcriptional regulator [Deltaproteobacteria bacterium]|nr:TetR/AcrR family transcriptional regulator [Deltaproteobacteria bacterium]